MEYPPLTNPVRYLTSTEVLKDCGHIVYAGFLGQLMQLLLAIHSSDEPESRSKSNFPSIVSVDEEYS